MNAQDINETIDLPAPVERFTHLREVGANRVGPCASCRSHDSFTLNPTPKGWRWHCRKCGAGKSRTVVDCVMQRDGVDSNTAPRSMRGEVPNPAVTAGGPDHRPLPPPLHFPSLKWHSDLWPLLEKAPDPLLHAAEGQSDQIYNALQALGGLYRPNILTIGFLLPGPHKCR
jgi:hypothetical protein